MLEAEEGVEQWAEQRLELRSCPVCYRFARLTHMFNPRENKIVRLYECKCGQRTSCE